jgi:transcriptional/translational regulatory protein YebC/TACO1
MILSVRTLYGVKMGFQKYFGRMHDDGSFCLLYASKAVVMMDSPDDEETILRNLLKSAEKNKDLKSNVPISAIKPNRNTNGPKDKDLEDLASLIGSALKGHPQAKDQQIYNDVRFWFTIVARYTPLT